MIKLGIGRAWGFWMAAVVVAAALLLAAASAVFEHTLETDHAGALKQANGTNRSAAELLQQGAYIARLGNCQGCHSAPGGVAFAGPRQVATPFGAVVAGNLTPDEQTGLGRWSADDLWRALRLGRSRDGRLLLPVFPYPHYSRITRADADALFAYLRSLPPVDSPQPAQDLRFPANTQAALAVWRLLFFRPAASALADRQDTPLQRGAYLVQGLGHCGACHAPRNAWGASANTMTGGTMPGHRWYAPSLLPDQQQGPDWARETVVLLKTGGSAIGRASGPMAAVVGSSLQHWTAADLQAAVFYLQSLAPGLPAVRVQTQPASGGASWQARGAELYKKHCADCHGEQGQGVAGIYPTLVGNATVLQPTALNLVQIISHGGFGPTTVDNPRPYGMPPLVLKDADLAAVVNHVRRSWGNQASEVAELDVLYLR